MSGESPREAAASSQNQHLRALSDQFEFGNLSAKSRFQDILPYISNSQDILKNSLNNILMNIGGYTSTKAAGLGQDVGDALYSKGVAPGQDMGSAWVTQMSPIYAEGLGASANAQQSVAQLLASLESSKGSTLMDLMKTQDSDVLNTNQIDNQAIGSMKNTTGFGDVMGVISTIGKIVSSMAGIPGLDISSLFGGAGGAGGGVGTLANSGFDLSNYGANSDLTNLLNNRLPFGK